MTEPATQIDPAERWTVWQDSGAKWNRHILIAGQPDMTIAFMSHSDNDGLDAARARLAAAAPDLLAAIELLIEDAQPDNWDDDDDPGQAAAWRAAFRAMLTARGLPIPAHMEAKGGCHE